MFEIIIVNVIGKEQSVNESLSLDFPKIIPIVPDSRMKSSHEKSSRILNNLIINKRPCKNRLVCEHPRLSRVLLRLNTLDGKSRLRQCLNLKPVNRTQRQRIDIEQMDRCRTPWALLNPKTNLCKCKQNVSRSNSRYLLDQTNPKIQITFSLAKLISRPLYTCIAYE